jgi:hypothetical protein
LAKEGRRRERRGKERGRGEIERRKRWDRRGELRRGQ